MPGCIDVLECCIIGRLWLCEKLHLELMLPHLLR